MWAVSLADSLQDRVYAELFLRETLFSILTIYRDLCMHKYAIDETPHFFFLTGQRHPIGCLRQLVSTHILQGELE